ncbi:hypothetical protein HYX58_06290 [Candidatus Dependentiae bacterium]|nr:hypothetical protein [Candidatus Dependentiae bacterium]
MNIKILFLLLLSIAQQSFCMETGPKKENSPQSQLEQNRFALYRINMIQLIDVVLMQRLGQYRDTLISQLFSKGTLPKEGFDPIQQDLIKNFKSFNKFFPGKAVIADEWTGEAIENFRFSMAKTKISLEQEIARQEGKKYIADGRIQNKLHPSPDFLELVALQFSFWSLNMAQSKK